MGHLKGDTKADISISICRNLFLRAILEYKKKYERRFGEIVIAVDGNNYWRRSVFPDYKCTRKQSKEDSGYDWAKISECIKTTLYEIDRFFPYTVVMSPEAEGDDVIAILVKWSQENDLLQEALFSTPKDSIILSADGDFQQLSKYKNIKQFSPMTRKPVTLEQPLKQFCLEHVLCGDGTDSISNILSPQNFFKLKESSDIAIRQKPVTVGIKKFYYDQVLEFGEVRNFRSESEEKRFRENEIMVLFENIPDHVTESVLNEFKNQKAKNKTRKNILNYLVAAKLGNLIEDADNF